MLILNYLIILSIFFNLYKNQAIEVDDSDWNDTLAKSSLGILNFYVNWCIYCKNLEPIYSNVASIMEGKYKNVVLARIDGDRNRDTLTKFNVRKFPTLIIFKNGKPNGKEYMGRRTEDGLIEFLESQIFKGPKIFQTVTEILFNKDTIVGLFKDKSDQEYKLFLKINEEFIDDCNFYASFSIGFIQAIKSEIYFVSHVNNASKLIYNEPLSEISLRSWIFSVCRPLVKEITYKNAEEITNSGIPLLILFVKPDDNASREKYKKTIERFLPILKDKFKFLYANAFDFQHPLYHLGHTPNDSPIMAIDDYKHMYPFSNFNQIENENTFKQFIEDYESGKLHKDLHSKEIDIAQILQRRIFPDMKNIGQQPELPDIQSTTDVPDHHEENQPTKRIESVFKKLAPNQDRYTMLKFDDEL